jgi:hypothetical protein
VNCLYIEIIPSVEIQLYPSASRSGNEELAMPDLNEFSKTLGGMPLAGLIAVVVLAAFCLSAFAIYAIMTVAKPRSRR